MRDDERPENTEEPDADGGSDRGYTKPKLTYVAPKMTKVGDIKEFTGGFFGTFSGS